MARRAPAPPPPSGPPPWAVCALAWLIPGAGHLWLGRARTGVILLVLLPVMFAIGLWLEGEIFLFDLSQPLAALSAFGQACLGGGYALARALGVGEGRVVAATYEYGNTFMVVAGLLNALVVIDAYDIVMGRK